MARIEHIKRRLENWAVWSERNGSGGSGFAKRSVLLSDVWSRGSYNGVVIPVSEAEAWETDRAVTALKLTQSHLYLTVTLHYLRDMPIKDVALHLGKARSTVLAHLAAADHAVDAWLRARSEAKQAAAGGFTT